MNRIFDLIAVACVAVVILLPKPSVEARPALAAVDPGALQRVGSLEDALVRAPDSEEAAVELAEQYLRLERPDWALVTLSRFSGKTGGVKLALVRATAHAERLDAPAAIQAVEEGRAACAARPCAPQLQARLEVIAGPMQALVDQKVDPRVDPQRAKQIVTEALHRTRPGKPAGKE